MQNLPAAMDSRAFAFSTQGPSQPRIAYFVSRSDGTLVPLIPADELPFSIRLQGLPRTLRFDQTHGMQHVGTLPYTGVTFKVKQENSMARSASHSPTMTHTRARSNSPSTQFLPPDALARQAIANATAAGNDLPQHALPPRPVSAHELATTQWRKTPMPNTSDKTQAVIDAIVSATRGPDAVKTSNATLPPSGQRPDQEKKKYCTYWIRHGECDYIQQGCLYLHEMPDVETLKAIGLRGTPRWWLEKNQKVRMGDAKPVLSRELQVPSNWPGQSTTPLKLRDSEARPRSNVSTASGSDADSEHSEPQGLSKLSMATLKATQRSPQSSSASPVLSQADQLSDTGDLIDLGDSNKTPVTPPSTPPKEAHSTTSTSEEKTTPLKPASPEAKPPKTPPTAKIFVPAGESPALHLAQAQAQAQAKKRAATRPRPSTTRDAKTAGATGLQKQIQILQKSKHSGLAASKHASSESSASPPGPMCRRRVPKREYAVPIRSPEAVGVKVSEGRKGAE